MSAERVTHYGHLESATLCGIQPTEAQTTDWVHNRWDAVTCPSCLALHSFRAAVDGFLDEGAQILLARRIPSGRSDVAALLEAFTPHLQSTLAEVWRQAYTQGTKDMVETGPLRLDRPNPFEPEERPAPQVQHRPRGAWE